MTWHDDIVNLHRAYGPVVRIAPNEASIVDAGAQKKLYSHGSKARKTSWYDTWSTSVPVPVFFSETDTKIHGALRRGVSAAFSMSSILKYEKYVQSCLDVCYGKIRKHAEAGRIIDMSEWTHMLTFDIVGELTFGQALGQMETETDLDDVRKTNTSDIYWAGNLGHMWLQSRWVNNLVVEWLKAGSPAARFSAWVFEKVIMRKEGRDGSDREDMLSHFLKMKPLGTKKALEDIEVVVESANVVGAGADTTAIGMRSCLYFILQNPSVYQRLQKEIDDYYVSANLQQPISFQQTQELPYLKSVIAEATRLYPSIVYQLLRHVPDGGMEVNGHFLPAGTPVGMSPIAANRDKAIWGEDADVFLPERWLENPERSTYLESYNMTYGGHGSRACIGRNLALVEMNKFVAQMMRNFNMEITDRRNPWKIKTYWFMDQLEFKIRVFPREHKILL